MFLPEKWDRIVCIYFSLFYSGHFTAFETHLNMYLLLSLFIYPTDAQLDCYKRRSKFSLKFTLKCPYMFRFNNRHQGATIRALPNKARMVAP